MRIDCKDFTGPDQLHAALAEALSFPAWYGHNLDALYDCLTDLESETHLMLASLPAWAENFRQVLTDAAADNPLLTLSFE